MSEQKTLLSPSEKQWILALHERRQRLSAELAEIDESVNALARQLARNNQLPLDGLRFEGDERGIYLISRDQPEMSRSETEQRGRANNEA